MATTEYFNFPLPSANNTLDVDVVNLQEALTLIDTELFGLEQEDEVIALSLEGLSSRIVTAQSAAESAQTAANTAQAAAETIMTGATADAVGTSGRVPVPAVGAQNKYFTGGGNYVDLPVASDEVAGIARQATDDEVLLGDEELSTFVTPYQLQTYGVPSGFIGMWSGSTDTIPTGWALCDGENNTPDLRNRFIVGAGSTYAVGGTGGSATVTPSGSVGSTTLTTAQMPKHTHTYTKYASQAGSGGSASYWCANSTGTTSSTGSSNAHTHTFTGTAHTNLPPYYALAYIMKL